MKEVFGVCALLLVTCSASAYAEELAAMTETTTVEMLNNFELLAEKRELPYAIRVIRLGERRECDGMPQSCPMSILYITASTFDEVPDQKVYKLPKAYGWEFVRWKVVAREEGRENYTVIEVKRKIIAKNAAKDWWAYSTYEVFINPWQGQLREVHQK